MTINGPDVKHQSTGRSRGRPAVPLDRIVTAALEIVDEQGADALSMRSLAQRLGSGTATLYRHFASRSELVSMVVDRMLEDVVRLNERVRKLGGHFEQARGDVDQIRISTEGIVRHGERIRAVELGEVKVELAPVLSPAAKASGE